MYCSARERQQQMLSVFMNFVLLKTNQNNIINIGEEHTGMVPSRSPVLELQSMVPQEQAWQHL